MLRSEIVELDRSLRSRK